MTEVGHADLSRLLQSKRNECHAIVTSRKRKLRELFAVATQTQPLPQQAYALPDAPAATSAEWQFLQTNDILQYVAPPRYIFFERFCDCFEALVDFLFIRLCCLYCNAH
ncbi:Chromatin modification-related protein EAF1 [Beauveria bassiana]|nr:Chromatin modification-related protein EAF1 [Beauveria bassiana]